MKECSKSAFRRMQSPSFVNHYFCGHGIDIGGAPDPLDLHKDMFPRIESIRLWDLPQGDAQFLAGIEDESLDFVHSSHCLEHLNDPVEGLIHWFRVLKPGGHLIVSVPDEDLYEQALFPSTFNTDHKWTFTLFKAKSWCEKSLNLLDVLPKLGPAADIRLLWVVDIGYRPDFPRFDQTNFPGVESAIEFVVRKRPLREIQFGGHPLRTGTLSLPLLDIMTGGVKVVKG